MHEYKRIHSKCLNFIKYEQTHVVREYRTSIERT